MSYIAHYRLAVGGWRKSGKYEFRKEAEAYVAVRREPKRTIVESVIVESPDAPTQFWDFSCHCSFQRTPGFKHSPLTLKRLTEPE